MSESILPSSFTIKSTGWIRKKVVISDLFKKHYFCYSRSKTLQLTDIKKNHIATIFKQEDGIGILHTQSSKSTFNAILKSSKLAFQDQTTFNNYRWESRNQFEESKLFLVFEPTLDVVLEANCPSFWEGSIILNQSIPKHQFEVILLCILYFSYNPSHGFTFTTPIPRSTHDWDVPDTDPTYVLSLQDESRFQSSSLSDPLEDVIGKAVKVSVKESYATDEATRYDPSSSIHHEESKTPRTSLNNNGGKDSPIKLEKSDVASDTKERSIPKPKPPSSVSEQPHNTKFKATTPPSSKSDPLSDTRPDITSSLSIIPAKPDDPSPAQEIKE